MDVPSIMALVMYCSACSFGLNDGSHIHFFVCGGLAVLVILVTKHLTVILFTLYVLVLSKLVGDEEI